MGRIIKATVSLLCLATVITGCNKPGTINPNLNHVDVITPGIIPGKDESTPSLDIDENWGIDMDKYEGMSEEEKEAQYREDVYQAQKQYYATYMSVYNQLHPEEVENPDEDDNPEYGISPLPFPTVETFSDYAVHELLEVYGGADGYGFYDFQYQNACSKRGQIITKSQYTYDEEVVNYSVNYGYRDTEFVYDDRKECYWFEDDYVYSVAYFKGGIVTTSISPYATDWENLVDLGSNNFNVSDGTYRDIEVAYALYTSYGRPIQEDFHHLIWKTDTGYVCYNRRTHAVKFTEE